MKISKSLILQNAKRNKETGEGHMKIVQVKRDHLDDGIESFQLELDQRSWYAGPRVIVHFEINDYSHET